MRITKLVCFGLFAQTGPLLSPSFHFVLAAYALSCHQFQYQICYNESLEGFSTIWTDFSFQRTSVIIYISEAGQLHMPIHWTETKAPSTMPFDDIFSLPKCQCQLR